MLAVDDDDNGVLGQSVVVDEEEGDGVEVFLWLSLSLLLLGTAFV